MCCTALFSLLYSTSMAIGSIQAVSVCHIIETKASMTQMTSAYKNYSHIKNQCVCWMCAHIHKVYVFSAAYCSQGFLSSLLGVFPQAWLEFNLTVSNFPSLAFNLFSSLWLLTLDIFFLTPPPPRPSTHFLNLPEPSRAKPVLNTERASILWQPIDQLL